MSVRFEGLTRERAAGRRSERAAVYGFPSQATENAAEPLIVRAAALSRVLPWSVRARTGQTTTAEAVLMKPSVTAGRRKPNQNFFVVLRTSSMRERKT